MNPKKTRWGRTAHKYGVWARECDASASVTADATIRAALSALGGAYRAVADAAHAAAVADVANRARLDAFIRVHDAKQRGESVDAATLAAAADGAAICAAANAAAIAANAAIAATEEARRDADAAFAKAAKAAADAAALAARTAND